MPSAFSSPDSSKIYRVPCDCGCTIIEFTEDNSELFDNDLYIEFKVGAFYERQHGIWFLIKNRLKLIWLIARGKEFRLHDIVIGKKEFKEWLRNEFLSE